MAGLKITQERPHALQGRRYGSFVGKPAGATHPVGRITQLRGMALSGRRYGSFAGRAAGVGGATIFGYHSKSYYTLIRQ